ncbi:MAG: molybdopterin dinucleotide binding domain-containing protein, partial [Deltaproteobacteria bacterium]
NCPFVVVSDVSGSTDTAVLADVLLPAAAWGEKDGTVTNSERRISRQRAVMAPPGDARPDWWMLAQVAQRMGFAGFEWAGPSEIFAEHAALSGVAARLGSDFDISLHAGISNDDYEGLKPFTWPTSGNARFFADGQFHTPNGKGRMVAVTAEVEPFADGFRLNTGRNRDQWHTMTRTAKSPRLSQHLAEPYLEIHPADAAALGLKSASLAQITNVLGRGIFRTLITDRVQRGEVFAPMHWTAETAPSARVDVLVPSVTDPVSGQPDLKAARVDVGVFNATWHGFAVSSHAFGQVEADYFARMRTQSGWRIELAGTQAPADWLAYARALFSLPESEVASIIDAKRGRARFAFHLDGKLIAALFVGPEPLALARDHIASGLLTGRPHVLAGQPGADHPDPGATICSCLNVGVNTIRAAIESGQAVSIEAIGKLLGAGTNCGSCRPEIATLLATHRRVEIAAQ